MAVNRRVAESGTKELAKLNKELSDLTSQLSLVEENERRRIAIELHDRTNEILISSIIKLAALTKSVTDPELAASLNEICQLLRQLTQETRLLMFELYPPSLYYLGLVAAIKELTDRMMEKYGIQASYEDDNKSIPMPPDIEVLLFQSVRELLANVARHAQAQHVKVIIASSDSDVRITVQDDGVGFGKAVISDSGKTGGFGLYSISERLRHVGGHLQVESDSRGTKVMLTVPLRKR